MWARSAAVRMPGYGFVSLDMFRWCGLTSTHSDGVESESNAYGTEPTRRTSVVELKYPKRPETTNGRFFSFSH